MTVLSAADATLLALIAENPGMPAPDFQRLTSRLAPESQKIAGEIVRVSTNHSESANVQDPIVEAAESIVRWAKGNKKHVPGLAVTL